MDTVGLLPAAWRIGGVGRVACQPAPPNRVLQCSVQDGVHVVHNAAVELCSDVGSVAVAVTPQQGRERAMGHPGRGGFGGRVLLSSAAAIEGTDDEVVEDTVRGLGFEADALLRGGSE